MNFLQIENFFTNLTFFSFFSTSLIIWINKIFLIPLTIKKLVKNYSSKINFFFITFLLIFRWVNSHHFPLTNLYESLFFLSWCLTTAQILIETKFQTEISSILIFSLCLLLTAFSNFFLPIEMKEITPLVPALKSNWLFMHVSVILISYACLIIGCLFAFMFLILKIFYKKSQEITKIPIEINNLSYKFIGFGFPLLTLGIISGAVWANQAWGSYWSWDPKETWALITWIIFAMYFHIRLQSKIAPEFSALIASFGFIVIWICYLGVNLLGKGLHSYGWWI
uniref:Cytochrome c biogenesis protein CcsA n=1 Tax=Palmophyllum crassum TaxID=1615899 RepID=A0A1L7NY48_9VIRI|nr:cytochrome c biogenesis protein [Palmophyllum crassum]BAW34835.1 cytochrome c biogenesis protein [Palmophyllum crassum]